MKMAQNIGGLSGGTTVRVAVGGRGRVGGRIDALARTLARTLILSPHSDLAASDPVPSDLAASDPVPSDLAASDRAFTDPETPHAACH